MLTARGNRKTQVFSIYESRGREFESLRARQAGARLLLFGGIRKFGGIHKMSTLVQ